MLRQITLGDVNAIPEWFLGGSYFRNVTSLFRALEKRHSTIRGPQVAIAFSEDFRKVVVTFPGPNAPFVAYRVSYAPDNSMANLVAE